MSTLAVVGATGMLGQPVTRAFIEAGFPVRIVARDVSKARTLFPGAAVVAGDLRDPAGLMTALRGVATVYLNLSVRQDEKPTDFHTEAEGLANLLAAARQAGVGRVAYLSSLVMRYQGISGFDWWVFRVKQRAVQLIRESGIPYSIFYPSNFMETLLHTQRVGPLVLVLGRSDVRPHFMAARDYGRQVVRALQIAGAGQHQEYVVQGPEALTQWDAARRLAAAYTKSRLVAVRTPMILVRLGRRFSQRADYGWHIGEALNQYPEAFEAEQTWADLGRPDLTIDAWTTQMMDQSLNN